MFRRKGLGLMCCLFTVVVCAASGCGPAIPIKYDVVEDMVVMLGTQLYKLTPVSDQMEQFSELSTRGKYEAACEYLRKPTAFDKNIGARLIVGLLDDGSVTALEYLSLTCDIQEPSKYTTEELLEIIIRKSA